MSLSQVIWTGHYKDGTPIREPAVQIITDHDETPEGEEDYTIYTFHIIKDGICMVNAEVGFSTPIPINVPTGMPVEDIKNHFPLEVFEEVMNEIKEAQENGWLTEKYHVISSKW